MVKKQDSDLSIASLVLGIVTITLVWVPIIPTICSVVGLILGIKQNKITKNSMNTAGIILNSVGLGLSLIIVCYYIFILVLILSSLPLVPVPTIS